MSRTLTDQIDHLIALGYPAALGMSADSLRQALCGLAVHIPPGLAEFTSDPELGRLPFVLVINSPALPVREMLPRVVRRRQQAVERLYPIEPERFQPVSSLGIPAGQSYLLFGIDRGMDTLNAVPNAAQAAIEAQGRSPITVEEGVALLTQFPEFLQPNNCFLMLGSRCGDKRVPAFWLSERRPKLGWCWAGNPHTWLGAASCQARSPAITLGAQQLHVAEIA